MISKTIFIIYNSIYYNKTQMHVTYGFVYYFSILMIGATLSLTVFILRPLRKKVFDYLKKIKLMDNFLVQSVVYISFFVIFVILIDAVWTYYGLRQNLERGIFFVNQAPRIWKTLHWIILNWLGLKINKTTCSCTETIASFICQSATSCWQARLCSSLSFFTGSARRSLSLTTCKTKLKRVN